MPPPTTCWALAQSSTVSTQCRLVSTSINSVSSWLPLPSDKSHLDNRLFKKNGFLACCGPNCGADLGLEVTANSLRQ